MDPKDFCYWMQGYCELTSTRPTDEQWDLIREHLQLVFTKVTSELKTEVEIIPSVDIKDLIEGFQREDQRSTPESAFCMPHPPLPLPSNICADVACNNTKKHYVDKL